MLDMDGQRVSEDELLALGQIAPGDPFNMAYLAERGAALTLGVSRLHGEFSRGIFQPLFPRWPNCEVPIGYVTNGVHIPTWDLAAADKIWSEATGKERWRSMPPDLGGRIATVSDEKLWAMRGDGRQRLVKIARERLRVQLRERGDSVTRMEGVLDPNILTIGFARRFTEYKRPNLLLRDMARLYALLNDKGLPIQIVVAGKAHPADFKGKEMVAAWVALASQPRYRRRVVFLEDYDIDLAQELVQGVDVWINTPRRPWEACGTSGMKVLVNGGLNCSIRDGWWDEGYTPEVGWAIGDGKGGDAKQVDEEDANSLYTLLERDIIPLFYRRDEDGLPRAWLARIRSSMLILRRNSPQDACSGIMWRRPICRWRACCGGGARIVWCRQDPCAWLDSLEHHWSSLHIGQPNFSRDQEQWRVSVPIFLEEVSDSQVHVELFADATGDMPAEAIALHKEQAIPGAMNGYVYGGAMPASRAVEDYTVRIVPYHPDAQLPAELPLIAWQRRRIYAAREQSSSRRRNATTFLGGREIGGRGRTNWWLSRSIRGPR